MDEQERCALVEQVVSDRATIFRTMRADWTKELITGDLTLPQVRVLFLLEQADGLSMSSLAEALGKAQPTVTGLVDRLVETGLVERAEHTADRRVILARLTAAGHDLITGLHEVGGAHTRRLIGHLSPDELQVVARAYAILRREALASVATTTGGTHR